jgi:hypothetical protein
MQLGPDRLPDAITLELAKDVVDSRAGRKSLAGQIAPRAASAQQNRRWRSSLHACRSRAVAHPATPRGSAVPAAPTPHPSDRSDNRSPPADRSDGAPPSTSPLTITVSPLTGNHDAAPHAIDFWVRLSADPSSARSARLLSRVTKQRPMPYAECGMAITTENYCISSVTRLSSIRFVVRSFPKTTSTKN